VPPRQFGDRQELAACSDAVIKAAHCSLAEIGVNVIAKTLNSHE